MKNILHISDLHLSVSKNFGFHETQAKKLSIIFLKILNLLKKKQNLILIQFFLLVTYLIQAARRISILP